MRILAVATFVGLITLWNVIPANTAVAVPKPPFDWTQFLKAGVKRAATDDGGISGAEEVDIDYQDSQVQIKPIPSFTSIKPTFMPPFVDPQFFIDKKTALLNGLFGPGGPVGSKLTGDLSVAGPAIAPNFFAGKKTAFLSTLFNQLAMAAPEKVSSNTTKADDVNTIQRRLVPPWLTTPPPVVDPKIMTDKKAEFLDKLFSSFNTVTTVDDSSVAVTIKPTIVPPNFWMPFAGIPPVAVQPTVKPTIVPPDFWSPFPASKAASIPKKPTIPVVDPSVFVDKKTAFLNELMNSLSVPATVATPVSTVDEKVSQFLDKLLEALTVPTSSKRSVAEESYGPRSIPGPDASTDVLLDSKDRVVDTIVGELTGIKNNMVDTLTDLLKSQKETAMAATPPITKPGKKVTPSFGGPFAGLWGPGGKLKPTPDPTIPFQQKIDVLNQVFDMLTSLQRDVTIALNEAATPKATIATPSATPKNSTMSVLDLLKKKLMEMDTATATDPPEVKPQVNMYGIPLKYNVRDVDMENRVPRTRNIKMALHQGYQSLPPGTTETLQAGGGSIPHGKEGGGIKMQNDRYDWQVQRHHHH